MITGTSVQTWLAGTGYEDAMGFVYLLLIVLAALLSVGWIAYASYRADRPEDEL